MAEDNASVSTAENVAKGAAWMLGVRFTVRIMGFVSTLILARLLVPEDFGLIALSMSIFEILETVSAFGLENALINNQKATRRHYDTAWTINLIRGFVIAALLFMASGGIASLANEPRLEDLLKVVAIISVLEFGVNITVVDFRKNFQFHKDFIFFVLPKFTAVVTTLSLALTWRSYWALIVGITASRIMAFLLSYIMTNYYCRFRLKGWQEFLSFSFWLTLSNVVRAIATRLDNFILVRLINTQSVGYFTVGKELATLPSTELIQPILRALYPGFAKVYAETGEIKSPHLESTAIQASVILPLGIGVALLAEDFVHILLGSQWTAVPPIVSMLAITTAIGVLGANVVPLFMAVGRTKILFYRSLIYLAVQPTIFFYGTYKYGLTGAVISFAIVSVILALVNTTIINLFFKITFLETFQRVWRSFISTIVMAGAVYGLQQLMGPSTAIPGRILNVFSATFLGGFVYVCVHFGLWHLTGKGEGPEPRLLAAAQKIKERIAKPKVPELESQ